MGRVCSSKSYLLDAARAVMAGIVTGREPRRLDVPANGFTEQDRGDLTAIKRVLWLGNGRSIVTRVEVIEGEMENVNKTQDDIRISLRWIVGLMLTMILGGIGVVVSIITILTRK